MSFREDGGALRITFFAALLLCALNVPSARAQSLDQFERILIPVSERSGAYGSSWSTTLLAMNTASTDAILFQTPGCSLPHSGCDGFPLPQDTLSAATVRSVYTVADFVNPSVLLYVDPEHASDVHFSLHTRDVVNDAATAGAEIPVVRERDLLRGRVDLLNVPMSVRSRIHLRVYDPFPERRVRNGRGFLRVKVSFYRLSGPPQWNSADEPDAVHEISGSEGLFSRPFPASASYAAIHNVEHLPGLEPGQSYRIQIESDDPESLIWAFVSITNNETQHVTLVSPQ